MAQENREIATLCRHCGAELDEAMPGVWVSGGGLANCYESPTRRHVPNVSPYEDDPRIESSGGVEEYHRFIEALR